MTWRIDYCILEKYDLENRLLPDQIKELENILWTFSTCFSCNPRETNLVNPDIELISEDPISIKLYKLSPRQTDILKNEIQKILDLKIIEPGESDYTLPMILIESTVKDLRPFIEFRKLNAVTKIEYFPSPNIEEYEFNLCHSYYYLKG
ncbi:RNA-directed DNA polymerase [Caerostris darwini]|uniref:RNA-directed DNA polymerase n=1 Tax=Caerostris darwini TaxID=1538125 RepID=A0AAV4RL55_9ARAC|nr:RNA-directed DNA polymerase [Caerostris darwini]